MKKKICLVIPSLHAGGMERVMSELASYFCANKELEAHLILYGISPKVFYSIPHEVILHQPKFQFDNSQRLFFTIKTLFFIRKKIKSIKPNSVLSFGEYWNSFVLIALLGLKFSVFVSDRCQPDKSLGKLHNYLRKKLYPKATGIIAQTEKAKHIYSKMLFHSNIRVIGNPIRHLFSDKKEKRENIILTVGRLIKTKHHDLLIDIFSKIDAPNWKLVIVGGDAIKQNGLEILSDKIKSMNLNNRVILTGSISNVEEYYCKSKIFAFTSSSEGFPNVIGEALSAGLPVVSYDCIAGPSEMIKDGTNGFLVPVFDDELFLKKLQLLIDDETLRNNMAHNARKEIKKFSVESVGQQYLDCILPR